MSAVLKEKVDGLIAEILQKYSYDLFESRLLYRNRECVLEVYIDKPKGGISLDECSNVNRELSQRIENENFFLQPYSVSVSSPGLDRPLKTRRDFCRVIGKIATFYLNEKIGGKLQHDGVVLDANEESVSVRINENLTIIKYSTINKAVLII
ncbi:MAG: hypothetical protein HQL27_06060 [Candidatus Omnitrophica bacterium]|nr:hypothetical protein [Candidatus Omnitrophota bacterium]